MDGVAQVLVSDISKIEEGRFGTLSFLADPKYTEHIRTTAASVVLVARNFQGDTTVAIDGGTVNVKRTGEKMEVKVELRDSVSKTVEVNTH